MTHYPFHALNTEFAVSEKNYVALCVLKAILTCAYYVIGCVGLYKMGTGLVGSGVAFLVTYFFLFVFSIERNAIEYRLVPNNEHTQSIRRLIFTLATVCAFVY